MYKCRGCEVECECERGEADGLQYCGRESDIDRYDWDGGKCEGNRHGE